MNRIISVFGEPVEVVVTSQSTRNAFCVGIQTCPPGGGPPPHIHGREDEMFHVVEGTFEMFDGERWTRLNQGETTFSMRGQVHAFRNAGTTPGRMLFLVTPGGLDDYFDEISPLALPHDKARLDEVNRMYGVTFLAP